MPRDSDSLETAHSAIRAFWEEEGARYDQKDAHGIFSETERQLWTGVLGAIPASSRVLDIATGTGFVALLLAELGHQVTGFDRRRQCWPTRAPRPPSTGWPSPSWRVLPNGCRFPMPVSTP